MDGLKDPPDIESWSMDGTEFNGTQSTSQTQNTGMESTASGSNIVTQNTGTNQQKSQENYTYTHRDSAPYRIYVELKKKDEEKRINKFSLGSMIRGMNEYRRHVTDMKYVGNNKILVFINSFLKANSLMETLNKDGSLYKAYIPRHLVTITGVVSGIPTDIMEEEIEADIESEFPIVGVRRLTRNDNGDRVPTTRVSITFRAHELPKQVKIFCCRSSVRPFFQKVVICTKCLRFNHREQNCRGYQRCYKCTKQHETREEFESCKEEVKCASCRKSGHSTMDPSCPEKQRQEKIKNMMARKCVTYTEARDMFPVVLDNMYERLSDADEFPTMEKSFANVTGENYTWKNPLREQWVKTNLERKAIQAAVKIAEEKEKNEKAKKNINKRPRSYENAPNGAQRLSTERNQIVMQESTKNNNGAGLKNPFSVNEKERWETIINEANAKAEAKARATVKVAEEKRQAELMSFYADFVDQLGSSEASKRFKECTVKHFNLTNTVVNNRSNELQVF